MVRVLIGEIHSAASVVIGPLQKWSLTNAGLHELNSTGDKNNLASKNNCLRETIPLGIYTVQYVDIQYFWLTNLKKFIILFFLIYAEGQLKYCNMNKHVLIL